MRITRLDLLRRRHGLTGNGRIWVMIGSMARVPTGNASRYLQQLCKHWQHNLAVEFTPEAGTVIFPKNARGADWPGDATLSLAAQADALECTLQASSEAQLAALKDTVARHLDRFAFREAPLRFDWQDG